MYEYACEKDINLKYIDSIFSDLEHYRVGNSVNMLPINRGGMFDPDGHATYIDFGPHEAEVADRILASKELDHTYLDQGFLVYQLNREKTLIHSTDFDFLEKIMRVFSPNGDRAGEDFEAFRDYTPVIAKELPRYYRTKEPDKEMSAMLARQELRASSVQDSTTSSLEAIYEKLANYKDFLNDWLEGKHVGLDRFREFYFSTLFSLQIHYKTKLGL